MDPGEAISAVKALAKANAQGQRIYQITPANQGTTLPNIHHHLDTMTEIRTALAAGLEVITHTDAVSIPGWSETGYIILDPGTGSGAFKAISENRNPITCENHVSEQRPRSRRCLKLTQSLSALG